MSRASYILMAIALIGTLASPASAQTIEFGFEYAEAVGLPNVDITNIVTGFIRALIGFLGFFLVIQIMWGGLKFMFAGGSEEKRAEARAHLQQSIIGFFIIMSASSIAKFVVGAIVNAGNPDLL